MPPSPTAAQALLRKCLLACGAVYGLLYVIANDVIAAGLYQGYSRMSQAISELSASGVPSQRFLHALLPLFSILLIAFGLGVWRAGRERRALRVTGGLLMAQGITGVLWLLAPMSPRATLAAAGGSWADVLHLVLGALSVLFIVTEIGVAATAFRWAFRVYSLASMVTVVAGFGLTAVLSSRLAAGEATPWLGLVERMAFGAWLLWMAMLAAAILRVWPARHALRGGAAPG